MEQYKDDETKIEIWIPSFMGLLKHDIIPNGFGHVELKGYYPQTFTVWILSNGSNSDLQIKISKSFHDESIDKDAFDEIIWTFSIIDINGFQNFIQSFATIHNVNSPYEVDIPGFINVSTLINKAEEYLPEDQLTVCCEVTLRSNPGKSLTNATSYHLNHIHQKFDENISFERVLETEKDLIVDMCNFLVHLYNFRNDRTNLEPLDLLKQELLKKEKTDERMRTYMYLNPIFQTYCRLERKLMKELEIWPSSNVGRNLQTEFRVLWSNLKHHLKQKLDCLLIKLDTDITPFEVLAQKLNRTIEREETNDTIERKETTDTIERKTNDTIERKETNYAEERKKTNYAEEKEETNDKKEKDKTNIEKEKDQTNYTIEIEPIGKLHDIYYKVIIDYLTFFWDAIEDELKNDDEYIGDLPECNNDNNHNSFILKTKDGVIFTLPFQDSKELGSKLKEESKFFKDLAELSSNEIKGPVCLRENSQEFLQVLRFLQEEPLHIKPFQLLCDTYKTADKYMMEKMITLCAELMEPLLSKENINTVTILAKIHHCQHLKKIVHKFNNQKVDINFVN